MASTKFGPNYCAPIEFFATQKKEHMTVYCHEPCTQSAAAVILAHRKEFSLASA